MEDVPDDHPIASHMLVFCRDRSRYGASAVLQHENHRSPDWVVENDRPEDIHRPLVRPARGRSLLFNNGNAVASSQTEFMPGSRWQFRMIWAPETQSVVEGSLTPQLRKIQWPPECGHIVTIIVHQVLGCQQTPAGVGFGTARGTNIRNTRAELSAIFSRTADGQLPRANAGLTRGIAPSQVNPWWLPHSRCVRAIGCRRAQIFRASGFRHVHVQDCGRGPLKTIVGYFFEISVDVIGARLEDPVAELGNVWSVRKRRGGVFGKNVCMGGGARFILS
jgi:hypothetical protein